jgi:hypothetical protein
LFGCNFLDEEVYWIKNIRQKSICKKIFFKEAF